MNIAVIGTGYVGLVTGTCFAETGNNVICVDIDENKVNKLKSGKITIYEPGLEVIFERNTEQGRLKFTTDLEEGIKDAKVIFLALPTPPGGDGAADLSYVLNCANDLGKIMKDYKVIVDKSTVPVGTAEAVRKNIEKSANVEFDVVSNPEFLREGVAVEDFMKPDRIVIGTSSSKAKKIMETLYAPFVRQGNPVIFMDERSAEMTKYAANSYLAMRISFMNEIANLCEKVGADVDAVRKGMGTDTRIGKRFLFAGIGYGGSCFPKDVKALARTAADNEYDFKILNSVINVNDIQRERFYKKIEKHYNSDLKGKKFGMWGLAFKPNTDDIREAPSLYVIEKLIEKGAEVVVFDPEAIENVREIFGDKIKYAKDQYGAIEDVDALIIVTEWSIFRTPDFEKMSNLMKHNIIFDGRNLYEVEDMKELGFTYNSVGRSLVEA